MILASPLWLLALVPWAGAALWLLIGRNPRVAVPFIELWHDSDAPKRRVSRALKRPPAAIACALLAMLLALVAAARPALVHETSSIAQIAPKIRENVRLVRVAVRETPHASVMVRVRNQSDMKRATIVVSSASRDVELPARDAERDYFIDLDRVGDEISVELVVDDQLQTDNHARLVREHSPAKLEARSTISPELARMIEVYSRRRPWNEASNRVAIVDDSGRLSPDQSGVVVTNGADRLTGQTPIRVSDHPITAHVRDWNSIVTDSTVGRPPGDGWRPLVQSGDRVLVAVRDQPVRQAWVAFSSAVFARSTDFVIFWTDVFDWLGGGGGSEFRLVPSTALNVQPAKSTSEAMSDRPVVRTVDLSRALLLIAIGFLALAAMLWKRVRSPKQPAATQDRHQSVAAKPLA